FSFSSPSSSGSRSPFSSGLGSPTSFEQRSSLSFDSGFSTPVNPASATPSLIESDIPSESELSISYEPTFSPLLGSASPEVSKPESSTTAELQFAAPRRTDLEFSVPYTEHCFALTTGTQKKKSAQQVGCCVVEIEEPLAVWYQEDDSEVTPGGARLLSQ